MCTQKVNIRNIKFPTQNIEMGCVIGGSKIQPIDIPRSKYNTPVKRVSVMLVSDTTLNLLNDTNELRKGTYDVIAPQYNLRIEGIPVEQIANQLEVPRCE